jgi:hypothetical protein
MIADSERFLAGELHICGYHINALFSVPIRHFVIVFKGVNSLPISLFVLYVAEAFFIYVYFAKVVKKRYYCSTLVRVGRAYNLFGSGRVKLAFQALVDVE